MKILGLVLVAAACAAAADNTLTPEEQKAGWRLLFDGKTFAHWRDPKTLNVPGDAWTIEEGCLRTVKRPRIGEDLLTTESFSNFELQFDWKVPPRGNTGVKYLIQREVFMDHSKVVPGPDGFEGMVGRELASHASDRARLAPGGRGEVYTVAFEFQLLDDVGHPDALHGDDRKTGALYRGLAPTAHPAHPAGEWNHGLLVVQGKHIEHWVNGVKVVDGRLDDPRVIEEVKKRWGPAPEVVHDLTQPKLSGPIALQFHGDEVWFKNIKVRTR
jgi:hypothetical protein